ncbi:MAG: hypothetical protein KAS59_07710, partial [Alphaproteobacteria bacterium]|nr:hypothetical protein [Alphaproteobacteria bacterium]
TNDTIRIISNASTDTTANPSTPGTTTVQVVDGTNIKDDADTPNEANTSAGAETSQAVSTDIEISLHIGDNRVNVTLTGRSGSQDAWVMQCATADLSGIRVGDMLSDEAASAVKWRITAVDDGADTITVDKKLPAQGVWLSDATGPDYTGSTQAVAGAWYTDLTSWESDRDGNITATGRNTRETAECYNDWPSGLDDQITVDGFTTDASHYMKITVPEGERHNGTAGTGFYIDKSGYILNGESIIALGGTYGIVEWVEIKNYLTQFGHDCFGINIGSYAIARYNLVHDSSSGSGIRSDKSGEVYNNIFYDLDEYGIFDGDSYVGGGKIYNNTVFNIGTEGIKDRATNAATKNYLKNNLVIAGARGGTCFAFSAYADHDYNASSDATATGSNSINSGSATPPSTSDFVSITASSEDLHLVSGAPEIGAGTDLSGTFTDDIDGGARNSDGLGWDIGADEVAAAIYYSVGTSTANLRQGTQITSITSGAAVFATGQVANIGVGDKITYAASAKTAYISGRVDATHYNLLTATGHLPDDEGSSVSLDSITRAFNSLASALPSGAGGAKDADHLDATDLVAGNYQLNISCYADAADTVQPTIVGWTTGPENYIRVYTPVSASEVGTSQRHNGVWDTNKYNLTRTSQGAGNDALYIRENYVRIEGLQVRLINSGGYTVCYAFRLYLDDDISDIRINSNIIRGSISEASSTGTGIGSVSSYVTTRIYNNIFYGFINGATDIAGMSLGGGGTYYLSNNTLYGNYKGIYGSTGTVVAKNNVCIGNTTDYLGTFDTSSNNISSDATSPDGVSYQNQVTTVDVDSNSGQAVLNVAVTTGFSVSDNVVIDPAGTGGGKEICTIDSIQAGVSLTMTANLANTHTAAQADTVSAVIFVDETGTPPDFHLASNDTGAKDLGTDLSDDTNLAFSDDIDGQARPGGASWDIGGDEYRVVASISSANNQNFFVSDSATAIAAITVTANENSQITAAGDIIIKIPSGFNMEWD